MIMLHLTDMLPALLPTIHRKTTTQGLRRQNPRNQEPKGAP